MEDNNHDFSSLFDPPPNLYFISSDEENDFVTPSDSSSSEENFDLYLNLEELLNNSLDSLHNPKNTPTQELSEEQSSAPQSPFSESTSQSSFDELSSSLSPTSQSEELPKNHGSPPQPLEQFPQQQLPQQFFTQQSLPQQFPLQFFPQQFFPQQSLPQQFFPQQVQYCPQLQFSQQLQYCTQQLLLAQQLNVTPLTAAQLFQLSQFPHFFSGCNHIPYMPPQQVSAQPTSLNNLPPSTQSPHENAKFKISQTLKYKKVTSVYTTLPDGLKFQDFNFVLLGANIADLKNCIDVSKSKKRIKVPKPTTKNKRSNNFLFILTPDFILIEIWELFFSRDKNRKNDSKYSMFENLSQEELTFGFLYSKYYESLKPLLKKLSEHMLSINNIGN